MRKDSYNLVIDGKVVKTAPGILYLRRDFLEAYKEGKDVHIIKISDGRDCWFNGQRRKK